MNKLCRHMVIGYTYVQTATLLLFFRLPMLICSFVAQLVHPTADVGPVSGINKYIYIYTTIHRAMSMRAAENVTTVYAIGIRVHCGHRIL